MKVTLITLLFTLLFQGYPTEFEGKVVNVIDGNTLEVENGGEVIKVMLKEADCPELSQQFGEEAKAFTEKLLLKKKVKVELKGKDRWGNKLAVISYKNGKLLHEELIKNGFAWAAQNEENSLQVLASEAKQNKSGLWQEDEPTPPWIFRRKQTMMRPKSIN